MHCAAIICRNMLYSSWMTPTYYLNDVEAALTVWANLKGRRCTGCRAGVGRPSLASALEWHFRYIDRRRPTLAQSCANQVEPLSLPKVALEWYNAVELCLAWFYCRILIWNQALEIRQVVVELAMCFIRPKLVSADVAKGETDSILHAVSKPQCNARCVG